MFTSILITYDTSFLFYLQIIFFRLIKFYDFCCVIITRMAKFTPAFLKKLEDLLKEQGYDVRYEKGNFKSGFCVLEEKKVVVINKFSTLESRIQALTEIIVALTKGGQISADLRSVGLKNPMVDGSQDAEIEFDAPESTSLPAEESSNTGE